VRDLTFIFGHTHKPFEHRTIAEGFDLPPAVYNTGGWDLDMPMFGTKLGAAAVFIDDDLNVASLQLCHVPQEDDGDAGSLEVRTADGTIEGNDLAAQLKATIESEAVQPAWAAFSAAATAAYRTKQAYIIAKLRAEDKLRRKTGGML
jgi:hypothetical protein